MDLQRIHPRALPLAWGKAGRISGPLFFVFLMFFWNRVEFLMFFLVCKYLNLKVNYFFMKKGTFFSQVRVSKADV